MPTAPGRPQMRPRRLQRSATGTVSVPSAKPESHVVGHRGCAEVRTAAPTSRPTYRLPSRGKIREVSCSSQMEGRRPV